ncbi:hypothetical protein GN155_000045 [Alcanivorax sp. ZXX171]|nr:hypothetical protein [Alcanivorax sp. ZXX171]
MIELIVSAIGGAGIALAIAAYLSKSYLKIQSDKLLARHAHALAVEKELLGHDLAAELHQKKVRTSRFETDRVEALKAMHEVIVDLSAALGALRSHANIRPNQDFRPSYFNGLKGMFSELSDTFNEISDAYRVLDKNAIYMDDSTESSVRKMLDNIQEYYVAALKRCQQILSEAQALEPNLNASNQPKELVALWTEMVTNWKSLVDPSARLIKREIREQLSA